MATHRGDKTANSRRVRPTGVTPLEVWDVLTSAGPLHLFSEDVRFAQLLVETLTALREGRAERANGERLTGASDWDGLVVSGGGLERPGVRRRLSELGMPLAFLSEYDVLAWGGAAIATGPVVDVGQTAIKVFAEGRLSRFPRDWARLDLRTVVAEVLRSVVTQPPTAVVFALPCEFRDDVPGPCSYPGLEGDHDFVPAVLAEAGWPTAHGYYLNDAELAAIAVATSGLACGLAAPAHNRAGCGYGRTLVLTLGYGVGAALLETGRRMDGR